ncbi:MAG: hypothetical protein V3T28_06375 [Gemmatimonadales bacterium]
MRRQFLEIGVLALAIGVATVWLGWWTVPLVGGGWGVARRGEGYPALTVAVSASLAWVLLLAVTSLQGPVGDFATTVGGVMGIPGWVLIGVTLAFPAVLAGTAAAVAEKLVTLRG